MRPRNIILVLCCSKAEGALKIMKKRYSGLKNQQIKEIQIRKIIWA